MCLNDTRSEPWKAIFWGVVYVTIADLLQIPDDFAMWDMEFWQPLLHNGTM